MAATGSAIAMGSVLLLSGDHRVGQPKTKCQAIEVAIGMTIPIAAIEIMRMRLTPAALHRGAALCSIDSGDEAIAAGWLDAIVEKGESWPLPRRRPPRRRSCTQVRTRRPSSRPRLRIEGHPARNRRAGNGIQFQLGR